MPEHRTTPPRAVPVCADCSRSPGPGTRIRRGLCEPCYRKLPDIESKRSASRRRYYTPARKDELAAKLRARRAEWIAAGLCTRCGRAQPLDGMRYCSPCYEKHYIVISKRRQRYKDLVFAKYGGYLCACCGETEPLFLSLDHINGGGGAERKALGRDMYVALARGPVRDDLRVLCHNCNRGRWLNGGECPHASRR